jgi:transcriptional regulator with XRE-family HTH domain
MNHAITEPGCRSRRQPLQERHDDRHERHPLIPVDYEHQTTRTEDRAPEPRHPGRPPHATRDGRRCLDVNAVVSYNVKAIRVRLGLTQVQVAERLAKLTGHQLSQASISAMERSYDGDRRRVFDAHELYLLSKVFEVPIVYFFLPPTTGAERTLTNTGEPVVSLLATFLGSGNLVSAVDSRLVELDDQTCVVNSRDGVGSPSEPATGSHLDQFRRWRSDRLGAAEGGCGAQLGEIATLLRALLDPGHGCALPSPAVSPAASGRTGTLFDSAPPKDQRDNCSG